MVHDVFVSYSSKDKVVADAVCATLEANRIRCWIAPRDVPPGVSWPAALSKAIDECGTMVLVFSSDSNRSPQVIREVERAVSKGKPIIPFRIQDIQPSPDMGYLIGALHWLDALTPPLEAHLRQLVITVQSFLSSGASDSVESIQVPRVAQPKEWQRKARKALTGILIGFGVLAILVIVFRLAGFNTYYYPNRGNAWEIRWGPPPTPVPGSTRGTFSSDAGAPTLVSMINAPAGPTPSPVPPTRTVIPTATATPSPTRTAIPTDKILLQEHFDNPQYNGSLPLSLDRSCVNGLEAQKDGALVIVPSNESFCSVNPKVQVKPDQFRLLQTRLMYTGTDRVNRPVVTIGFAMHNPATQEFLDIGANLMPPGVSFGMADHTKPQGEYGSPFVNTTPGTWYTLEVNLNNPETLEFFFDLNGVRVGSYGITAERAARWKSNTMSFSIGHSSQSQAAPIVYLDDLLIVGR